MDHECGVVEPPGATQRRPDDEHRIKVARSGNDAVDRAFDRIEQGILEQEIVDGIGGEPEFGKDHDRCLGGITLGGKAQRLGEIEGRIRYLGARDAGGEPDEIVAVEAGEIRHGCSERTPVRLMGRSRP